MKVPTSESFLTFGRKKKRIPFYFKVSEQKKSWCITSKLLMHYVQVTGSLHPSHVQSHWFDNSPSQLFETQLSLILIEETGFLRKKNTHMKYLEQGLMKNLKIPNKMA